MKLFLISLVVMCFSACKHLTEETSTEVQQTDYQGISVEELLKKAMLQDTMKFDRWEPFISFVSYRSQENKLYAFAITRHTDSTMLISRYALQDSTWKLISSLSDLRGPGVFYHLNVADYDFDGVRDVFITSVTSNGIALSQGNLVITDDIDNILVYHPEADTLYSPIPDPNRKLVMSQKVINCAETGFRNVCDITNKWVKGRLVTTEQNCPCETE